MFKELEKGVFLADLVTEVMDVCVVKYAIFVLMTINSKN